MKHESRFMSVCIFVLLTTVVSGTFATNAATRRFLRSRHGWMGFFPSMYIKTLAFSGVRDRNLPICRAYDPPMIYKRVPLGVESGNGGGMYDSGSAVMTVAVIFHKICVVMGCVRLEINKKTKGYSYFWLPYRLRSTKVRTLILRWWRFVWRFCTRVVAVSCVSEKYCLGEWIELGRG